MARRIWHRSGNDAGPCRACPDQSPCQPSGCDSLLAGTDAGNPGTIPVGSLHGEVGYLVAAGLTPPQALAAATSAQVAACGPPANTVNLTDNWQVGWTVGAGVEWRFAPQWSVKAEYLYVDLGNISNTINYNYGPSSSLTSTYNERDNIVRAGINYKFW